jgi:hypothetical protein
MIKNAIFLEKCNSFLRKVKINYLYLIVKTNYENNHNY